MTRTILCLLITACFIAAIGLPAQAQQQAALTPKVYQIKYRNAADIAKLLVGINVEVVSGSINHAFNTLTVRADEQGHAAVADLIRKYDIPTRTIEFQFFLIKASTTGRGLKGGLPDKVQKALEEVASLTRYKGFELIDDPFVRAQEGKYANLDGEGIYNYGITIAAPAITTEGNKRQIRIDNFQIRFQVPVVSPEGKSSMKSVALSTSFSIDEGQLVVIGASQVEREDRASGSAVITIVTAKIL